MAGTLETDMKRTEIEANARRPYADKILQQENEIRLLRALAKALGASQEALDATRYTTKHALED